MYDEIKPALLNRLIELDKIRPRLALQALFDSVDDHLVRGDFGYCNTLLQAADPAKHSLTVALGFATATHVARDRLDQGIRQAFMRRLQDHLVGTCPPQQVIDLLRGLL